MRPMPVRWRARLRSPSARIQTWGAAVLGRRRPPAPMSYGESRQASCVGGLNGMTDVRIGVLRDRPTHQCVAYRRLPDDRARANPLPTYFGRLAAIDTQDVQATATAEVREANESSCVQHWGMADRWVRLGRQRSVEHRQPDVGRRRRRLHASERRAVPGRASVADSSGQFCAPPGCDYGRELILQNQDRRFARFYGRLDFGGGGCASGDFDDPPNRVRRFLNPSTIAAINGLVDADPDACWSGDPGCGQNLDDAMPVWLRLQSAARGERESTDCGCTGLDDPGQCCQRWTHRTVHK